MAIIKFVVPEEWSSNQKGDFFEHEVGRLLSKMRYEIIKRVQFTGMEIDFLAKNKDTSQIAFVECKFLADKLSSGIITDLLGKATIRDADIAYLFSVSDPGKDAKGVIEEIDKKLLKGGLIFAFIGPEKIGQMYLEILNIESIESKLLNISFSEKQIGTTTLIISPNQDFWVIEYINNNVPESLLLYPVKESEFIDVMQIRKLLDENKLWLGLRCLKALDWKQQIDSHTRGANQNGEKINEIHETISQIPQADQFDDYRPCRPEDFVGRSQLQKEIGDFLEKARRNETNTRIIALIGQSGFGKSSLIIKLANRFRNTKWRNKFYIFHVDTRSAATPFFIVEALLKGFNDAKEDGFIELDDPLSIDSIDSPIRSKSILKAINYLKEKNKLLLIFFDQFEELFIKEELFTLFENFKKLSLEIDELQENLVLGFSWRTGISLPEDHPAYHMWHELKERRKEFKLIEYDSSEISQQLQLLSYYMGEPLEPQLKRRLKEQCLGFPWLLKKLCIHIYRQTKKGVKQSELIAKQFNVKQLFEEDLEELSNDEISCLKYIAMNSPVDSIELSEKYEDDNINSLYARRLVIRAGHRYAIYWDIFRDYLINGKLPVIPLTAVPTMNVTTILRAIQLFDEHCSMNKDQLAEQLNMTYKTAQNIVGDLITFMIIRKVGGDDYQLVKDIGGKDKLGIASYLYDQLQHHKIIREIIDKEGDEAKISFERYESYIVKNYSSLGIKSQSAHVYATRLLQWFSFCGLVDLEGEEIIISQKGNSRLRGTLSRRGKPGSKTGIPLFLCASRLNDVVGLILLIKQKNTISVNWAKENKLRNAMYDAIALGILENKNGYLILADNYINFKSAEVGLIEIKKHIKKAAMTSHFLNLLSTQLESSKSVNEIGASISISLGKNWSESSKIRYISAGKKWLKDLSTIEY